MPDDPSAPSLADAFPEARRVGALLRQRGLTVATAESCTGGLVGAALTAIPGSSDYVLGGVIAYANEVKHAQLGVARETLDRAGAVSEEVAVAMARGVRDRLGADIGVAVTGVAGPGSDSDRKPAGLTWLAAVGPGADAAQTLKLEGDHGREGNRAAAVHAAMGLIAAAAGAGAGTESGTGSP